MERKISFKALYGSHNYGLNRPDSDKDYKAFYFPDFDDLYEGKILSKQEVGEQRDVEYHDVRKLPELFRKANVNFLEILFSVEVVKNDRLYDQLFEFREEIARMNLPYLFDACIGMFIKKQKEFARDANRELQKANKHAMSAYRILDFLERYDKQGFNQFGQAIYYGDTEEDRKVKSFMMAMRDGVYSPYELNLILQEKEKQAKQLESVYKKFSFEEGTYQAVLFLVKKHVREWVIKDISM